MCVKNLQNLLETSIPVRKEINIMKGIQLFKMKFTFIKAHWDQKNFIIGVLF